MEVKGLRGRDGLRLVTSLSVFSGVITRSLVTNDEPVLRSLTSYEDINAELKTVKYE